MKNLILCDLAPELLFMVMLQKDKLVHYININVNKS